MLVNRENLSDMFRGFQMLFQGAYTQAPSMYARVAMEVPSTSAEEHYGWLGAFPRFREWLGDRLLQSLKAYDYTIKNRKFELTIEVERDDIEDDKIGIYKPMFEMLGQESKTHPDELVFAALLAGFTNRCYDGQYFFDTNHPIVLADGTTGVYSNNQGGAGTPWFLLDVSRPLRPLIFQKRRDYSLTAMDALTDEALFSRAKFRYGVDARVNVGYGIPQLAYASKQTLDSTNYSAARAAMGTMKGDNGKVLNISGNLLVVPPTLEKSALEVIKAERLANGASNVMQNTAQVLVCPWLA